MSEYYEKYKTEIIPKMTEKFKYKNPMMAPKLNKIVVSMGLGAAANDVKIMDEAVDEMSKITGQKPAIRRAKKAISNFKLRQGMPVGCVVTLRGIRMYEFLERLIKIALPRIRDFRGLLKRSFDGRGGYSFGIEEHTIFTEINIDKVKTLKGMNISLDTTAFTDEEGLELLSLFGMPFRK